MIGEPENPFFLTRAALIIRGAQWQISISITNLRVRFFRLAYSLLHSEKNIMG